MARPRTHHDEKKQILIEVSFGLFMKNGYENTSIQDIMNAAQISKGAMYHYFMCKEEILDAVINYIIDLDVKRSEPILNSTTLRPIEKLMATMSIKPSRTDPEVKKATEYMIQRQDSIFDYRARGLSKRRTIPSLANLIREGVEAGEFHTPYPEEMATFIYASMQSIGETLVFQSDKASMSRASNALIELLTHCLGLEEKEHDYLVSCFEEQFKLLHGK